MIALENIRLKCLSILLRWFHNTYFSREDKSQKAKADWTAIDAVRGLVYKTHRNRSCGL